MKKLAPRQHVPLMFRALSDPLRLRMLHLLLGGELCVGDLVGILRVPQPTASRHLSYLRRARLVEARKDGLWMWYRLGEADSPFHAKLLECLAASGDLVREVRRDAARAKAVRRAGGCCPE